MDKKFIIDCLHEAMRDGRKSRLSQDVLNIAGFCPPKIRHFLNNLCMLPETRYLEIGTYKGASLLSAAYKNVGQFTAIDNFSEFDGTRKALQDNIAQFGRCYAWEGRIEFLEGDCWEIPPEKIPHDINIYYYDGNHSAESQRKGLVHFNQFLADRFVLMVDDYSWSDSIKGTREALDELNYKIDLKVELHDDSNNDGWWNGMLILLAEKR